MSKVQISRFQIILALIWSVLGTAIVTVPFVISPVYRPRRLDRGTSCLRSAACCPPASRHCSFMRYLTNL